MRQNLNIQHDAVNTYGGVEYSVSILAVSSRSLTTKVVVNIRTSTFELVVGQVALRHVFLPLLRFPLLSLHYRSILIHLIITDATPC